jgi:choline dehydrogenase-like flavoprotein
MLANHYDAIVIGSGISGGWAAKELTEKGLKTLQLERGQNIEHVVDYEKYNKPIWEFPHRGRPTVEMKASHPVQKRDYPYSEFNPDWWVNDLEAPYTEVKRFDWYRGFHVGGKSLLWGRQCYRWSDLDFEANGKEGIGVDWPIRYKDVEKWFDYVEEFVGISGTIENIPHLPDGKFLPPMQLNIVEKDIAARIKKRWPNERTMFIGRSANLTQEHKGRAACQYRNWCSRGCPYGAYFSTQSSTLPAAVATGNLTLRPYSIVNQILYDPKTNKAKGVLVIDAETLETTEYFAKVIFVCASTLGSSFLLLNSTSESFPTGLGNSSEQLGHNLMDHHFKNGAAGDVEGYEDKYVWGRRPNTVYVPRFRNINGDKRDYLRGFGYQGGAGRMGWAREVAELNIGGAFKDTLTEPGGWRMGLGAYGEMLPYYENKVWIDHSKKDKWGQSVLAIDCEIKDNERKMRKDMAADAAELLEAGGVKNVKPYDSAFYPGMCIHEMGTARMGRDPKTSVLNEWNQMHDVKNVFVTDGACMTSSSCVNPSLMYMALTARAANYAVEALKRGDL